jgi:hypothetical protein
MTHRALIRELIKIGSFLICAFLWSLMEYYLAKNCNLQNGNISCEWAKNVSPTFVSQNGTLIAIMAGAYAAFVLQQRGKFIDELRRWWNQMVNAKSEFYKYCDMNSPTEKEYISGFYQLSSSMDSLRLIYSNVGRSRSNPRGYYPYEQIRDIIDLARSLDPRKYDGEIPTYQQRQLIKNAIDSIFQSLRHAIQDEARATPPDDPTLFDSPHRAAYVSDLKMRHGVDVLMIRNDNKRNLP